VSGWGRKGEGKDRGIEWVRRGRIGCWEGEQWIIAQEKEGSERGENRDEKMMMVKLIGIEIKIENPK
jgi:hypothetical protein